MVTNHPVRRQIAAALLTSVFVAAGCGAGPSTSTQTTQSATEQSLPSDERDYAISPACRVSLEALGDALIAINALPNAVDDRIKAIFDVLDGIDNNQLSNALMDRVAESANITNGLNQEVSAAFSQANPCIVELATEGPPECVTFVEQTLTLLEEQNEALEAGLRFEVFAADLIRDWGTPAIVGFDASGFDRSIDDRIDRTASFVRTAGETRRLLAACNSLL